MKIYFSPFSPYVRKCLVAGHELGLNDRIRLLPSNAGPIQRDKEIIAKNPLGKVPTFITDDGQVLYDSRVICEYLDDLAGGNVSRARGPRDGLRSRCNHWATASSTARCWLAMRTWRVRRHYAGASGVRGNSTRRKLRLPTWIATPRCWKAGSTSDR